MTEVANDPTPLVALDAPRQEPSSPLGNTLTPGALAQLPQAEKQFVSSGRRSVSPSGGSQSASRARCEEKEARRVEDGRNRKDALVRADARARTTAERMRSVEMSIKNREFVHAHGALTSSVARDDATLFKPVPQEYKQRSMSPRAIGGPMGKELVGYSFSHDEHPLVRSSPRNQRSRSPDENPKTGRLWLSLKDTPLSPRPLYFAGMKNHMPPHITAKYFNGDNYVRHENDDRMQIELRRKQKDFIGDKPFHVPCCAAVIPPIKSAAGAASPRAGSPSSDGGSPRKRVSKDFVPNCAAQHSPTFLANAEENARFAQERKMMKTLAFR